MTRRLFLEGATAVGALAASAGVGLAANGDGSESAPVRSEAPTLSVTDRLSDRRYVVTGDRAYVVGTESGRFPAMGWHVPGEMGGVWSPPLKLLDGIWFGVDGEWLGEASAFTTGYGHARMELPDRGGLSVSRTDFVPDGRRAALFGLTFEAGDADESFTLTVDAHSELMSAYPWGWTTPAQETYNLEDTVRFDGERLVFRECGTPPGEHTEKHDWASAVGAAVSPASHEVGEAFWGPQEPVDVCPPDEEGTESRSPPRCDESKTGEGKGGRLAYEVEVPANSSRTVWIGVSGSENGPEGAVEELTDVLDDPAAALEDKVEDRLELAERTQVSVPSEPTIERSIDWSKQNLADSVQEARHLEIRYTNEGEEYPAPLGTVDRIRFYGAGFPDYPWLFGVDGEYTTFPALAAGQFDVPKSHMRALKNVSRIVNEGTGKVIHEVITNGAVYYGANSDPGNADETAKFPMAVGEIWRWTGDDEFRDEMYEFMVDGMKYLTQELTEDDDLWPTGQGNVERPGMGEEKLDVTVYTIRGLYALADMARAKDDDETADWATGRAAEMLGEFEAAWWIPEIPQHAGSLDEPDDGENDNHRIYQRHWIGVTPTSAEYVDEDGAVVPGVTSRDHGDPALDLRETTCYSGVGDDDSEHRRNEGLYHTGAPGCDEGKWQYAKDSAEKSIFTLNSAIMAVGEGNYGRLGPDQQRRYVRANAKLQLPDPDEQPGMMPEIAPSPNYGRSINLPFTERAMVLQAWGTYGTLWPVVRHYLGIRPDMGRNRLAVVPQVPDDLPRVAGENVRLGADGDVAVSAAVPGTAGLYRTRVAPDAGLDALAVGHVVPRDDEVAEVRLDGEAVEEYETRATNRGLEVTVDAAPGEAHTLVVRTARPSAD